MNANEGVEYEGTWLNGMRDGYGELRYKNGSIYQGNWQKGMKWGQGRMTYATGNYYEGNWENNKRNGQRSNQRENGTSSLLNAYFSS